MLFFLEMLEDGDIDKASVHIMSAHMMLTLVSVIHRCKCTPPHLSSDCQKNQPADSFICDMEGNNLLSYNKVIRWISDSAFYLFSFFRRVFTELHRLHILPNGR